MRKQGTEPGSTAERREIPFIRNSRFYSLFLHWYVFINRKFMFVVAELVLKMKVEMQHCLDTKMVRKNSNLDIFYVIFASYTIV